MVNYEREFNGQVEPLRTDETPASDFRSHLRRRVLTAFDEARRQEARPHVTGRVRRSVTLIAQSKTGKIAAAVVLLCVAGLIGSLLLDSGVDIALADVRQGIAEIQTARFKMIMPWGSQTQIHYEVTYMQPGLWRQETPHMAAIIDWDSGRMLSLMMGQSKSAHPGTVTDMGSPVYNNWLADLEQLIGSVEATDIGAKDIDGRHVRGWRLAGDEYDTIVWADSETAELVQVVWDGETGQVVLSDFEYNVPLDAQTFSLDPPPGFWVTPANTMNAADPQLEDIAMLLRIWASGNGNVFPDDLTPWKFGPAAAKADWMTLYRNGATYQQASDQIGRAFFLMGADARWTYAGRGVPVGATDTPVFWIHPTPGDTTCRVIFGDGKIREIPVGDLPASP